MVKIRTRQFVKRQMTQFRGQTRLTWLPVGAEKRAASAVARIVAAGV